MKKEIAIGGFWDRNEVVINRMALIFISAISVVFLFTIYRYSFNGPYAYDDFNLFVVSFSDRFLEAETLGDRIKYLFSPNNYPHTKFFGRLFSMVHYLAAGSVSFKFLIMIGAVFVTTFTFVTRHTAKFDFVLLIPLVFMLLLPERMNFWVGTASGYPILLVASLLTFYWLSTGKFVAPIILAFFTAFAQNPGIAIFIAALPLFLIAPNQSWTKRILWLAVFGVSIFIFWVMVISKGSELGNNSGMNITNLPQCLPSMLAYEGQFLSMPFFGGNEVKRFVRITPLLGIVISLVIFGVMAVLTWRQRKTFTPRNAMFLAFLLFCLSGAGLAALITDECAVMTDNVSPRYMIWSVMAWNGIYLFLLQNSSRKAQLLTALVFTGMFLPRFISEYSEAFHQFQERQYIWAQMGTMTNVPPKRARFVFENLDNAIKDDVYKPSFPDHVLSLAPEPVKVRELKNYWYDLVQNEHFCKLETIVKSDPNNTIEIWQGEGENLKRVLPHQTVPKTVKRFLEKGTRQLRDIPKITKKTASYIFISDNVSDCQNLRIRLGDKVSDYLRPVKNPK